MNDIEQQELKKENESLKEEIRLLKKKTELLSITQPLNKLSQFLIDRMDAIIFIKDVTNDFRSWSTKTSVSCRTPLTTKS